MFVIQIRGDISPSRWVAAVETIWIRIPLIKVNRSQSTRKNAIRIGIVVCNWDLGDAISAERIFNKLHVFRATRIRRCGLEEFVFRLYSDDRAVRILCGIVSRCFISYLATLHTW